MCALTWVCMEHMCRVLADTASLMLPSASVLNTASSFFLAAWCSQVALTVTTQTLTCWKDGHLAYLPKPWPRPQGVSQRQQLGHL